MSGIEPNPGPTTPTASGRQEGEGDDSASNKPVLKELLEQMKTVTHAGCLTFGNRADRQHSANDGSTRCDWRTRRFNILHMTSESEFGVKYKTKEFCFFGYFYRRFSFPEECTRNQMSKDLHHRTRESIPVPTMMISYIWNTYIWRKSVWFTWADVSFLPAPAGPRWNGKLLLKM